MATRPRIPPHLTFGPFHVNSSSGELIKNGIPIRLASQPFRLLMALLNQPGEVVTREELRAEIWAEGTFTDFDHGLHAAINKLRRALNDSAEHPRYIETLPGRGYRFIGTIEADAPLPSAPSTPVRPSRRGNQSSVWRVAITAACVASAFAAGWWLHRVPESQSDWKVTRLTEDAGLSDTPALSPDGNLVAYSSDRGVRGGRDLYVKRVAGGQPVRLTWDGAGNTSPDFSPDGARIVFRSKRDGGGIYEVPALGGDIRLIAREGQDPKYSPDGSHVAYWVGAPSVAAAVPGSGAVWVVPLLGGHPQRVGSTLTTARFPIWSRNGDKLLVVGYSSAKQFDTSAIDWWLLDTNGGPPIRTGAYEAMKRIGLPSRFDTRTPVPYIPSPGCWSPQTGNVAFTITDGSTRNIWEIGLSAESGQVTGAPHRLTTGSGDEAQVTCTPGGAFAFANFQSKSAVWLLPFDPNGPKALGPPERLPQESLWRDSPSLSGDGRFIAFTSDQLGAQNIWLRNLMTGEERSVAASPYVQRYPVADSSGSRIAFSVYENNRRAVYVSAPGGTPEKVCDGCFRATDWSRDDQALLVFAGAPYHIGLLDIASHREIAVLQHAHYPLLYARFSPDNRWISFTIRVTPTRGRIAIAPASRAKLVPEKEWRIIADTRADDYAAWSPDGKTLYYTSPRDGYSCLWRQSIDTVSGRPSGEPFAVRHFHGRLSFEHQGWSSGVNGIAIALQETTGNVWMMTPAHTR